MTKIVLNNPEIEKFLKNQANQKKIDLNDYIIETLKFQMEYENIKNDMQQLEEEITKVNNREIKLDLAQNILNQI